MSHYHHHPHDIRNGTPPPSLQQQQRINENNTYSNNNNQYIAQSHHHHYHYNNNNQLQRPQLSYSPEHHYYGDSHHDYQHQQNKYNIPDVDKNECKYQQHIETKGAHTFGFEYDSDDENNEDYDDNESEYPQVINTTPTPGHSVLKIDMTQECTQCIMYGFTMTAAIPRKPITKNTKYSEICMRHTSKRRELDQLIDSQCYPLFDKNHYELAIDHIIQEFSTYHVYCQSENNNGMNSNMLCDFIFTTRFCIPCSAEDAVQLFLHLWKYGADRDKYRKSNFILHEFPKKVESFINTQQNSHFLRGIFIYSHYHHLFFCMLHTNIYFRIII